MHVRAAIPDHFEILYDRPAIERRLDEIAPVLDGWAVASLAETGQSLLVVCVLRGGVFFFSDLLQRMRESVEPAFCRASSYARDMNQAACRGLHLDLLGLGMHGRDLVFVDNICDTGRTLAGCVACARAGGARMVRSVVLVLRAVPGAQHEPTLAAFRHGRSEWLVGYGMRDRDRLMNLPVVGCIRNITS